ncbi:EAL domain-containing protein [Candidatus Margulisiibacteriota bacterium]
MLLLKIIAGIKDRCLDIHTKALLFENILESFEGSLCLKDILGCIIAINKKLARDWGLKDPREAFGKKERDFVSKESADNARKEEAQVRKGKSVIDRITRWEEVPGQFVWLNTSKFPLYDFKKNNKIIGNMNFTKDVTYLKKVEKELLEERNRLMTLINSFQDQIFLKIFNEKKGVFVFAIVNDAVVENARRETNGRITNRDQIIGLSDFDIFPEFRAKKYNEVEQRIRKTMKSLNNFEISFTDKKTKEKGWGLGNIIAVPDANGEINTIIGTSRDITKQKQAELNISYLAAIIDETEYIATRKDLNLRVVSANKAFLKAAGKTLSEVIGKTDAEIFEGMIDEDILNSYMEDERKAQKLKPGETLEREEDFINEKGEIQSMLTIKFPIFDKNKKVEGTANISRNITERKKVEQILKRKAYYDDTTNLPNRRLFIEQLEAYFNNEKKKKEMVAVLHIGIDNFRKINNDHGHSFGDALLMNIARRLKEHIPEAYTIGKLESNEFGIFLAKLSSISDVVKIANKIKKFIGEPFLELRDIKITATVGIAVFPDHADTFQGLIKKADLAFSQVWHLSRNTYHFFNDKKHQDSLKNIQLLNYCKKVLPTEKTYMVYQPQLDISTKKLVGVEALFRCIGEDGEEIPPAIIIPLAETTNLIDDILEKALMESCLQVSEWNSNGHAPLSVSVNVSLKQFTSQLPKRLKEIIHRYSIEPQWLDIELTERTTMEDPKETIKILSKLKDLGITISLDDFGVFHSSLGYLQNFPIDTIKIDKSFIRNITSKNKNDVNIVDFSIKLAKSLHLFVLAEGVETKEQFTMLRKMGCDRIQGYYYSRPLLANDFKNFLQKAY